MKTKGIKIHPNLIAKDNGIDLDRYNLPHTLGNPPASVQKMNDSAFQMIKPQLESMVADNMNHMLTSLGIIRFTDSTFLGYGTLANLSQNSLIRAGVEMRADEMTRRWGEVTRQGNDDTVEEDDDKLAEITQEMERYKIAEIFRTASCLNGYLGGCLLFIDTGADKNELVNPLILDAIRRRCPAADSYRPSSFCRTMIGVITPWFLTLSMSNSMSSSMRTSKGWSGMSSIMSRGICRM